jgi:hypothetical protein
MKSQYEHNIEVKGNYIYINNHCMKFDTEEQAQEFLLKLIVQEGYLDR